MKALLAHVQSYSGQKLNKYKKYGFFIVVKEILLFHSLILISFVSFVRPVIEVEHS